VEVSAFGTKIKLVVRVDVQNLDGCSPCRRLSHEPHSAPGKMLVPNLFAWVKKFGNGSGYRIDPCEVGAFVQVAVNACEAQVGFIIGASMFARPDVFNVKRRQRRVILMQMTILTPHAGTTSDESFRCFIHDT